MKSLIEKSSQPNQSNKPNKQTQALKRILEKKGPALPTDESNQTLAIDNTQDNLIERTAETTNPSGHVKVVSFDTKITNQIKPTSIVQSIELFNNLIDKELSKSATLLAIDEGELKAWIDLQIEVPAKTILALLRMIQNLRLDPLSEEIGFTQYEDGHWQVFITIEGCSKLLNQHPQFNGLVFNQADTLIDGLPEWMECSIYRKDRTLPTTVREYLSEVRGESTVWQKMPRRMLRHRALQQCLRLAIA